MSTTIDPNAVHELAMSVSDLASEIRADRKIYALQREADREKIESLEAANKELDLNQRKLQLRAEHWDKAVENAEETKSMFKRVLINNGVQFVVTLLGLVAVVAYVMQRSS